MELSQEDSLRLNVLLASRPLAIRIDEGKLLVQGLTERGESSLRLTPNQRPEPYLRHVRELISGHVLGSPGGYPVYLRRWTRMGQMRDESLEQLLLLGEPEAVVAAVCSPGLTDELARRAWWAMEDAENARRMLNNPTIVQGGMGPRLAEYLIEYLPFETENEAIIESVRLILQPGLIDWERRLDLWRKSARKQAYLVGFLRSIPDDLPEPASARLLTDEVRSLADAGNGCARLVERLYRGQGQSFIRAVQGVLGKPPSQDVLISAFECLRDYFAPLRPDGDPDLSLPELIEDAERFVSTTGPDPAVVEVVQRLPALVPELLAMRVLSGLGYGVIRPLLRDPTTQGTLMRRKLAPALEPLQALLGRLGGGAS